MSSKSRKQGRTEAAQQRSAARRNQASPGKEGRHLGRTIAGTALLVCLAAGVVFAYTRYFRERPAQSKEAAPNPVETNSLGTASSPVETNSLGTLARERQNETAAASLNAEANKLLSVGNVPAAIRAYQGALKLTPKDEDLHFNLGAAYAQNGDLTNAEREYQEALKLLPDYPEVHNNYGNMLMRLGRFPEAEEHLSKAIELMPEYSHAQNNLGILRQKQKRLEEARACFQKAVEADTNYWEGHFNLANAYFELRQPEKAIVEYRETLRLNPAFQPAESGLQRSIERQGQASGAPSETNNNP